MANNTEITEEISEMTEEISEMTEEVRHGREGVASEVVKSLNVSINIMDVRNFNRQDKPPTIHQISVDMRKGNESAYAPTQFPIGPYYHRHHEDKPLFLNGETDGIKILYLHHLLERNPNTTLEEYVSVIESREEEARDCYHDRCKGFQSKDFVEMMVLDGCFIVEFFLKCWEERINESWILNDGDLVHDLMLLENQIPFFILKLIHDNSQYQVEGNPGILDLALYCLYGLGCSAGKNITKDMLKEDQREEDGKNIYHLLHLNYLCQLVEIDPEMEPFSYRLKCYSGKKITKDMLKEDGKNICHLLHLKYLCHMVEIDLEMEAFSHMVNMLEILKWVLYWVFLCPIKYFLLMLFYALIFFLKFTTYVVFYHYLFNLTIDVLNHWKKDHNRWRAMMMRNYFSSPWSTISLLGAFTLLALTAVQVYYAIKSG